MDLYINSKSINSKQLHNLSLTMLSDINSYQDLTASLPQSQVKRSSKGDPITTKGDPVTIGQLALTFLGGGSAVALLEVIRAYISRNNTLSIELKNKDGSSINFTAENVNVCDSKELIETIQSMALKQELKS
ncbi:hypothetical protein LP316_15390 [Thalassotalea sp. LPB0316]|uniref:hypothetical protein n=1 Tax=Thalassotalea sp. LPB0316 TaxID=2769490 RepID=UPI00186883ED|nr:hypothetical protein [Thalassotalea sp. LPB0316]QOL25655.1 hypothetical protein LP316_15390 [Thalassotalea sp. LPB0316]